MDLLLTTLQVENGGRDLDITVPQDGSIFTQGSTEAMRILSGGNIGMGEDAPSKSLVISDDVSECVAIIKSSDTGSAGIYAVSQMKLKVD